MTVLSLPVLTPADEHWPSRLWWAAKNTLVIAKRSIARIARDPAQLLDVTVQPVIFVLLFTYVFGSAIHLPGGGDYHAYLVGGMFGMAMAGTAPGTAVGISVDMATGLIDRFRSLPISRSAVLAGRTIADLATQVIGIVALMATGLAVGWGMHRGVADAIEAVGLSLLIAFAMTWAGACAGMLLKGPRPRKPSGSSSSCPCRSCPTPSSPPRGCPPGSGTSPTGTRSAQWRRRAASSLAIPTRRRRCTSGPWSTLSSRP